MEMTDRKKKVLRSVVDLYIRTAEPVGSKAITELPDITYSSATIRNEMADLTAMGYLEQPHTSAGRVPSAAGYRLYVDELMLDYRLSMDETNSITSAIEEKMQRVDKMMEKVAKIVSQATDLPAISVASKWAETGGRCVCACLPNGFAAEVSSAAGISSSAAGVCTVSSCSSWVFFCSSIVFPRFFRNTDKLTCPVYHGCFPFSSENTDCLQFLSVFKVVLILENVCRKCYYL